MCYSKPLETLMILDSPVTSTTFRLFVLVLDSDENEIDLLWIMFLINMFLFLRELEKHIKN